MPSYHSSDVEAELSVLDALTASTTPKNSRFGRRDSELDPLLLAAVFSSGPHVTRNHYAHDFFPAVGDPRAPGAWDWTKWTGEDPSSKQDPAKVTYVSRQAPRRQRLKAMGLQGDEEGQEKENARHVLADVENSERASSIRVSSCIAQRPVAKMFRALGPSVGNPFFP
jgi:GTP cyclohydrolase II